MGNTLSILMACLCYTADFDSPVRHDIVITEIMANPASAPSLPSVKYIELYNRSAKPVNLQNWTISDTATTAVITESFILYPDSFVVISSITGASRLPSFVPAMGVRSFPTLRVNGDKLVLRSDAGAVIHAVAYDRSWYDNEVKSVSGWSLEMIDVNNPCTGKGNWIASNDPSGGTPGAVNSVAGPNPDTTPPQLLQVVANSRDIELSFNEPLDSVSAANINHYSIQNVQLISARPIVPFFNSVVLNMPTLPDANTPYSITVTGVKDCSGNAMPAATIKFGQPVMPSAGDIIFNEILFNPRESGVDYIELFNRSANIINLKDLLLNNRTAAGNTGLLRQISSADYLLFPGEYVLLSENTVAVQQQYSTEKADVFWEMTALPAMPNTAGHILLFNRQGETIDALQYEEKWHFPLVTNPKGVALERIDPDKPTQDKSNWHSAAASVGYGTPGYKNSQFKAIVATEEFSLTPNIFSPDNDGFDDFLAISYRFPAAGNVCNISVFDAHGRPIRKLVNNAICGTEGSFRWDGLDANNQQLRIGIYVIMIDYFHPGGKTKQIKKAITLARRVR